LSISKLPIEGDPFIAMNWIRIGSTPPLKIPVANEGLGWDSLLIISQNAIILVVTIASCVGVRSKISIPMNVGIIL